jgi:type III secretory pathway component EscV
MVATRYLAADYKLSQFPDIFLILIVFFVSLHVRCTKMVTLTV